MVEDAGIVAAPLKYLLITPLIYFFIFFVCVAILILSKGLERVSRIKYLLALRARWRGLEHCERLAPLHNGKGV